MATDESELPSAVCGPEAFEPVDLAYLPGSEVVAQGDPAEGYVGLGLADAPSAAVRRPGDEDDVHFELGAAPVDGVDELIFAA